MRGRRHDRQIGLGHQRFQPLGIGLLGVALFAAALEVLHRRQDSGDQHRAERGREDEAGGVGTDAVDDLLVGRDIAAHHPECLAQRALDQVDPVCGLLALGNPAAAGAVHADGVHLIDIGQRVVSFGQVADRVDRRDVAIHRIDAFEGDQLGHFLVLGGEQLLEMIEIIVPEDALFAARIADARNHAGVVELVGKDHAARQQLGQRRQRRVVRDIAAGEQQRAFLGMQIGELVLEFDMVMRVAADIARPARACADIVQRLFHRLDHFGVLAHGEVIVRTPHGDRLGAVMAGEAARIRERALIAQNIDEDAVASFFMEALDRLVEDLVVVHRRIYSVGGALAPWPADLKDCLCERLASAQRISQRSSP